MTHAIDEHQQEENPPFAMLGSHSPQHLFAGSISTSNRNRIEEKSPNSLLLNQSNVKGSSPKMMLTSDSQMSSNSNPSQTIPGLVESVMTDGSSSTSPSVNTSSIINPSSTCIDNNKSPTTVGGGGGGGLLAWSLRTVSSDIGASSIFPDCGNFGQQQQQQQQRPPTQQQYDHEQLQQQHNPAGSYGFSQLLRAADDANIQLGNSRMPVVPEHRTLIDGADNDDAMMHSGTLISSPNDSMVNEQQQQQRLTTVNNNRWIPSFFSTRTAANNHNQQHQGMLREPLLPPSSGGSPPQAGKMNQSILRACPYEHSLAQARTSINSVLEDDKSFEVSMDISSNDVSVQDIMNVLGNPDLLKLWCDPIQSLIVTSTSDGARRDSTSSTGSGHKANANNQGREYEGEWIEATTTALESPPSAVGFIFGAGQSVLHTLGFASYGKITMFVERQRGKVGLTVGPFQGGIFANHTIKVFKEGENNSGTVRLVDRVRLTHDEHETTLADIFLCGACGACLDKCLLPPLGSYVEQVKTSMGRLRLLVDNERRAPGGATVIAGGTLISVPVS